MARPACCDNLNVKRGIWTPEEDAKVLAYVSKHGTGNWTAVPKKAGLKRCGKSCRLRYTNYLRPDLNHESFSPQEEELIVKLHSAIGSRWSIIAQQLPGRTDNDVKNYWNTKLRKKLTEMGIDPVTHKPFSQILADYGNIGGGFPKGGNTTRIGSLLNRELKNAFMIKSEFDQSQSLISSIFTSNSPEMSQEIAHLSDISTSNNSLGLLAQLQAIQLVSHASSHTKIEQTQPTLSPSSSSLSSSSASSSATWQDFLSEDVFLTPLLLSNDNAQDLMMQKGELGNDDIQKKIGERKCNEDLTSSGNASFVEAMLERDNEMLLEFPSILEEPFYY